MKTLAKDIWNIFSQNWRNILLFELVYRGITLPAYGRFAVRGLRQALKLAGYSYLTAGNIGSFLLRPWTVLILAGVGAVGVLLLFFESAGLVTAFQGSAYYQKLTPLHIAWGALEKTGEELRRRNWRLGLILAVQNVLINLFFIFRIFTHMRPLNFVMGEITKEPWVLLFFCALILVCLAMALPASLMAYGCMVEQKSWRDSLERSRSLMRAHGLSVLFSEAGSVLLVIAVVEALHRLSVGIAAVFAAVFASRTLALAVLLSAADKLEIIFLFIGSILAVTVSFAAKSVAFYQFGSRRFHSERWDFSNPERSSASHRQRIAVVCVLAAVAVFYIFDIVRTGTLMAGDILTEMEITAHRGSSRTAPENTLAALEAAIEEMADSVEVDVQLTSDGVAVLAHDANLKRVAGINRSVGSMTWDELQSLDVGSWFSQEYAGEKIPTLEDAMDLCRGRIRMNIELKNVGKDSTLPAKAVELILERGMEEQCVVTSTSLSYLKLIKELAPQIWTGYIISAAYGDFYSIDAVDFISLRSSFVTAGLVESVHAQGKGIYAWTVNSKSELERLMMLGIDGVITDRPVLAREIIYREEATETLLEYLRLAF